MKKGYGVFGKAYEVMFRSDLHDEDSIDDVIKRVDDVMYQAKKAGRNQVKHD